MRRALVADSDPDELGVLSDFLASEAFEVTRTRSVEEALAALEDRFDLVVTDVVLARRESEEGLSVIRKARSHPRTEVIAVASFGTMHEARLSLEGGVGGLVIRGPDRWLEELKRAVGRARMRLRPRLTKIVATMGPACASEDALKALVEAGANVIRLNCSHHSTEDPSSLREYFEMARASGAAVLVDTPGPKIRLGEVKGGGMVELNKGQEFVITTRPVLADETLAGTAFEALPRCVEPGQHIYVNDGLIALEVMEIRDGTDVHCVVLEGGSFSRRKGVNLPYADLGSAVPTEDDVFWLKLAAELAADWVAASFVGSAEDIRRVKDVLARAGREIPVVAKIERSRATEKGSLREIIEAADGVMVARGDLAVEIPAEDVPPVQKEIIELSNDLGRPVICATQMLLSMVERAAPTRAETSDIHTAIMQGADAVMLSEETAVGQHPALAVAVMRRIAKKAEEHLETRQLPGPPSVEAACAMLRAMRRRGEEIDAVLAENEELARMLSRMRPRAFVLVRTGSEDTARRLALYWGVEGAAGAAGRVERVMFVSSSGVTVGRWSEVAGDVGR